MHCYAAGSHMSKDRARQICDVTYKGGPLEILSEGELDSHPGAALANIASRPRLSARSGLAEHASTRERE